MIWARRVGTLVGAAVGLAVGRVWVSHELAYRRTRRAVFVRRG